MDAIKDHMLVAPAMQANIIARVIAGGFGDTPDRAVHDLGMVTMPDGEAVPLHLRHAADAIIIDDEGCVVLVTRAHNPGAGKLALPGGFIDDLAGGVETPLATAWREAGEETGIDPGCLGQAVPVGGRRYDRPFDIRAAWNNLPGTGIRQGDLFAVSTQGFCWRVPRLRGMVLRAGDDAAAVHVLPVAALTAAQFAVPDHLPMIHQAMGREVMGAVHDQP